MASLIERVRPAAARWGTAAQQAEFLASQYLVRLVQEQYTASDETLDLSRRFLAAREALGDPVAVARARFNVGFVHVTRGELDEALPALESALETADRTGNVILRCRALTYLGTVHRRYRDLHEARRTAQQALQAGASRSSRLRSRGAGRPRPGGMRARCWIRASSRSASSSKRPSAAGIFSGRSSSLRSTGGSNRCV